MICLGRSPKPRAGSMPPKYVQTLDHSVIQGQHVKIDMSRWTTHSLKAVIKLLGIDAEMVRDRAEVELLAKHVLFMASQSRP